MIKYKAKVPQAVLLMYFFNALMYEMIIYQEINKIQGFKHYNTNYNIN